MHEGAATLHPPVKQNKGKELIQLDDSDAAADDRLSFGSSLLPDLPPLKNNVEAESSKRPPRRYNRSVSSIPSQVWREFSRERRQSEQAPENIPMWQRAVAPSLSFMYPTFGAEPTPYMPAPTTVWGPEDKLSSPLGQNILSYESPCGFVIPSFSMYDGSFDSYDHMLHFNQAMILNAVDDHLL